MSKKQIIILVLTFFLVLGVFLFIFLYLPNRDKNILLIGDYKLKYGLYEGYERVYDTKTNEIYKAENGFMDHDWNGRYEKVTDDMYNLPTSGYIEKK